MKSVFKVQSFILLLVSLFEMKVANTQGKVGAIKGKLLSVFFLSFPFNERRGLVSSIPGFNHFRAITAA